tara:strand:+ start:34 stop:954 length:921 start_codon:yes stop_codon:yes gene_type:complete
LKKIIINIIKGVVIGICNLAPGISGATVALILGVYQRTIKSISQIDLKLIKSISKFDIQNIKKHTDWKFLISLGIGVGAGAIICAKFLNAAFKIYTAQTEAYFFGVILAFTIYMIKLIQKWKTQDYIFLTIGMLTSLSLIFVSGGNATGNLFFIFFCGIVASIGLVTPGLSGSYIVLILGNLDSILLEPIDKITKFNFFGEHTLILLVFLLAQGIGGLLFSKPIKWCLEKYYNTTFATLSGLVLGSLTVPWPWKVHRNDDSKMLVEKLIYPTFENSSNDYIYVLMIIIGIISVIGIEKIARKYQNV